MPRWPQRTVEERFRALVDRSGGPAACWEWRGAISPYGYGHFRLGARIVRAHRLAVVFGDPPHVPGRELGSDELVRHVCPDGPLKRCCNPRHLEPGDHSENLQDAYVYGERGRRFALKPARALGRPA